MGGYLPRADGAFDAWQANFEAYLFDHHVELGVSADERTQVREARVLWDGAFRDHHLAGAAAAAAMQTKDDRRGDYGRSIREVVRRIQTRQSVTDGQRAALGITVPDLVPTPTAAPTTRPVVRVDFGKRIRHTLRYADEATPTRRARPRGVLGVEVWVHVSPPGDPPPGGPDDLRFLMLSTRSPASAEFSGSDAGKTAHYMLRWLSTRGDPGPWSETASATIGA